MVWSVLVVSRLEFEVVIYLSPTREFECVHNAVDSGLRVQANRAVRPDPLVRNDLVSTTPASLS